MCSRSLEQNRSVHNLQLVLMTNKTIVVFEDRRYDVNMFPFSRNFALLYRGLKHRVDVSIDAIPKQFFLVALAS